MTLLKHRIRIPGLTAIVGTLTGIAVALVNDPTVIQTVAGKLGVSVALLGAVLQAVVKPVVRTPAEAQAKAREVESDDR